MIEEIRKRIKARMDNTDAAGDYDEYADGQGVGLAAALRIIDEVEKEHPVPSDVEEAARAYGHKADKDGVGGDDYEDDIEIAFKAGIAWERERKMQRVGEEWGDKVAENPEIIFSTDGELTIYSFVGAPRWWATIREAEEALYVFKAGAKNERERLMKEAVEIDTDITINGYTKQHILHISPTDEHIQHLPQGEYKAIIIKKEK